MRNKTYCLLSLCCLCIGIAAYCHGFPETFSGQACTGWFIGMLVGVAGTLGFAFAAIYER